MRSLLEKAIVHLLNEEQDKAANLLHKFMVAQARQIHESLRQGDEVALTEGWDDEITSEEYFAEGDLDDAEDADGVDAAADEIGDEMGVDSDDMGGMGDDADAIDADVDADMDAADADADEVDADLDSDMDADGDLADRVDDLESQIEHLTSEFEAAMAELDDDVDGDTDTDTEDMGDGMGDDADGEDAGLADQMSTDMADEPGEGDMTDMTDEAGEGDEESEFNEDEDMDDGDLDDITESVMNELEKITVNMSEREIGTGKAVGADSKSPIPQVGVNSRQGGKPVVNKGSTHGDFEREASPSVKDMKARQNTRRRAADGQSRVGADGDKSALINKDFAGVGVKNTKSVIDGK